MNKSFLIIICAAVLFCFNAEAQVLRDRTGTSTTTTQTPNTNNETQATTAETSTPTASTESSTNTTPSSSSYSQQIANKVTDVISDKINLSETQKNQLKNTGASWLDRLWNRMKRIKIKNPFKR